MLVAAIVATAAMLAGSPAFAQSTTGTACGAATQNTVTTAYETTARDIYGGELGSPEVTADSGHVTSATYLASAVAAGNVPAIVAATHKIVYTPRWHIVRLRVLSSTGKLLADVGGPDVLAPVTGKLSYRGKVVGSFVMSVQDDLGYEKLVTRFTAAPIELYRGGKPLMGRDFPAAEAPPRVPPNGTAITVSGKRDVAAVYRVSAFPAGKIDVLLGVPRAYAALATSSCVAVNAYAYGTISVQIAKLFSLPTAVTTYVSLDHEFDSTKLLFVRQGATQLASSDDQAGPISIPVSGDVSYDGQDWLVFSFQPLPGMRVYILFPDSEPAGGPTGASGSS
jgi:hypothetical protein